MGLRHTGQPKFFFFFAICLKQLLQSIWPHLRIQGFFEWFSRQTWQQSAAESSLSYFWYFLKAASCCFLRIVSGFSLTSSLSRSMTRLSMGEWRSFWLYRGASRKEKLSGGLYSFRSQGKVCWSWRNPLTCQRLLKFGLISWRSEDRAKLYSFPLSASLL